MLYTAILLGAIAHLANQQHHKYYDKQRTVRDKIVTELATMQGKCKSFACMITFLHICRSSAIYQ